MSLKYGIAIVLFFASTIEGFAEDWEQGCLYPPPDAPGDVSGGWAPPYGPTQELSCACKPCPWKGKINVSRKLFSIRYEEKLVETRGELQGFLLFSALGYLVDKALNINDALNPDNVRYFTDENEMWDAVGDRPWRNLRGTWSFKATWKKECHYSGLHHYCGQPISVVRMRLALSKSAAGETRTNQRSSDVTFGGGVSEKGPSVSIGGKSSSGTVQGGSFVFSWKEEVHDTERKSCHCGTRENPSSAGQTPAPGNGSPSGNKPPGPTPAKPVPTGGGGDPPAGSGGTGSGGKVLPGAREERYLTGFDAVTICACSAETRKELLDGIAAAAAGLGLDLSTLGDWRARFLAGEFQAAAGPQAARYFGSAGGTDRFVVPARVEPGQDVTVLVDGEEVPRENVAVRPGKNGRPVTLVTAAVGPRPRGATITVTAPAGERFEGRRPPDPLTLATSTSIARGDRSTTITVTPTASTTDPEGTTTGQPADSPPGGGAPAYKLHDGSGFFRTLFDALQIGTTVAVPLGTAYLLRPDASASGAVQTQPGGVTTIVVPNETYDQALEAARVVDPSFSNQTVADSVEGGVVQTAPAAPQAPAAGSANALIVTGVFSPGGSAQSLPPCAQVVFLLQGDPVLADVFTAGSIQVELLAGGAPAGSMVVLEAWMDASGAASVSASLPPALSSPTGLVDAVVRCGAAAGGPVTLGLQQDVSIVALRTVVTSGSTVQIVLTNTCGGPVKGTLLLEGPGTFHDGSKVLRFDTWAGATAVVLTSSPGAIQVRFEPGEADRGPEALDAYFD